MVIFSLIITSILAVLQSSNSLVPSIPTHAGIFQHRAHQTCWYWFWSDVKTSNSPQLIY